MGGGLLTPRLWSSVQIMFDLLVSHLAQIIQKQIKMLIAGSGDPSLCSSPHTFMVVDIEANSIWQTTGRQLFVELLLHSKQWARLFYLPMDYLAPIWGHLHVRLLTDSCRQIHTPDISWSTKIGASITECCLDWWILYFYFRFPAALIRWHPHGADWHLCHSWSMACTVSIILASTALGLYRDNALILLNTI